LAHDSALDRNLAAGSFELAESQFLSRFLQSGMTVLDVGAHHGYFTLLSSRMVGSKGKVIAFEPSPRERVKLQKSLDVNACSNVWIEPVALDMSPKEADLFLVQGAEDYCNSLRPPAVEAGTTRVRVEVTTLDGFSFRKEIPTVDFIKLDVEGAELGVLLGAKRLLTAAPRPVLLVEVYDVRTAPWGYAAKDIVHLLSQMGYRWYRLLGGGIAEPINAGLNSYDMNLIAVPDERAHQVAGLQDELQG